jgi:phage terminase large subunit
VEDNKFTNPEYKAILDACTGWQRDAWLHGCWNIAAGQFFSTFRPAAHIVDHFDDNRGVKWFAALDYGYTHYTVVLLACLDRDDNLFVVGEHAERHWVPQRHAPAIKALFQRHQILIGSPSSQIFDEPLTKGICVGPRSLRRLAHFVAGGDLFGRESNGQTIASQYSSLGLTFRPANTNRVQGWAEIQQRLGDPEAGFPPTLFIHERCRHLLDTLPYLQHDPDQPADVLKINVNEEGLGGDDAADALRYVVATPIRRCYVRKLTGLQSHALRGARPPRASLDAPSRPAIWGAPGSGLPASPAR